jgi:hypothetical protein
MKAIQQLTHDLATKAQLKLMQLRKQEATPMKLALMTAARDDEALEDFKTEHSLNTYCVPVCSDPDAWLASKEGEKFMHDEFLFPHHFARLCNRGQHSQKDLDYLRWYVKVMRVWEARKAKECQAVAAGMRDGSEEQLNLNQARLDAWHAMTGRKREFIKNALTWHPLRNA